MTRHSPEKEAGRSLDIAPGMPKRMGEGDGMIARRLSSDTLAVNKPSNRPILFALDPHRHSIRSLLEAAHG